MGGILLFNKPFGVICQFSRDGLHPTLADYIALPDFYPAGRLDTDSEGLPVLTEDGQLQHVSLIRGTNCRKLTGCKWKGCRIRQRWNNCGAA